MKLKTFACLGLMFLVTSLASAQQSPSSAAGRGATNSSGSLVDWAQFHFDPGLSGYNPYETILSPANVGNVTLKWSYAPSEGWGVTGPPAVANGVMYFGVAYTGPSNGGFAVYALNADTGAFIWKYGVENAVFGSPAVANGVVYVSDAGNVYALDASTGALIWSQAYGTQSSPTVVNDVVYIASTDPNSDQNVYALNAQTGARIWSYKTTGKNFTSPAVANGVLYVSSSDGSVYALNSLTGALIWKKQFGSSIAPRPTLGIYNGGQAVANGVLYVGVRGTFAASDLYALDAVTGAILWRKTVGPLSLETPAVANGVVYVGSGDMVYALNATTGAVVWEATILPDYIVNVSSPIVANGVVYVGAWWSTGEGTGIGVITALEGSTGASLWNYQTDRGSGYPSFPAPAVVNGTIYGSRISSGVNGVGAWSLPNQ
jgi:outer membrane protein assembly factor BamB